MDLEEFREYRAQHQSLSSIEEFNCVFVKKGIPRPYPAVPLMRSAVILALLWPASAAALTIRPLLRTSACRSMRAATVPAMMVSPVARAGEDDGGCELIGEEAATGTEWWTCEEVSEAPLAACVEEDFGTGGGPGYLPQDGQVLCKVEKQDSAGDSFLGITLPKMPWDKND